MPDIQYRIYTENVNRQEMLIAISDHFDSFTAIGATGFWKNQQERSLIIEILGDESDKENVLWLAELIKTSNEQESVLVTQHDIGAIFV